MPRPRLELFPDLRRLLLLLFACAAVYLVGNRSVPLWDRDEPRFAQTSRQMLQSGDWVVPRLYDAVRTAKPPLIYWLQASSMKLLGDQGETGVFAARLPSSLAMVLTLTILAWVLWRHAGPRHALWTVLILSSCVLVLMAAKAGLTDSVLLLFVTVAQLCMYAVWCGRGSWGVAVIMAVAAALALLTKGPVAVGIQAMTLLALGVLKWTLRWTGEKPAVRGFEPVMDSAAPALSPLTPSPGTPGEGGGEGHFLPSALCPLPSNSKDPHPNPLPEYREREPEDAAAMEGAPPPVVVAFAKCLVGVAIVLAIGLPWVYLVEHRYPGFIRTAFNHEIKDRAATGLEGHKGWPGYYLVSIWVTFLPWSLILPLALVTAWKHRREPRVRFALAAVVGPWLMFEVVQTKLPHYLLPCFPPLAFLAADAIVRYLRRQPVPVPSTPGPKDPDPPAPLPPTPFAEGGFLTAVVIWAVIAALLGVAPWVAAKWFRPLPWFATAAVSFCAIAYAVAVAVQFRTRRPARALATMGGGMLAVSLVLFGLYLPTAPFLRLSIDAAGALREQGATGPGQAIMLDYKEPSLAFYQGGTIREETAMVATDHLLETCPPWLVMTDEVYHADRTDRQRLQVVATFRGLDLADRLRVMQVLVARKR